MSRVHFPITGMSIPLSAVSLVLVLSMGGLVDNPFNVDIGRVFACAPVSILNCVTLLFDPRKIIQSQSFFFALLSVLISEFSSEHRIPMNT